MVHQHLGPQSSHVGAIVPVAVSRKIVGHVRRGGAHIIMPTKYLFYVLGRRLRRTGNELYACLCTNENRYLLMLTYVKLILSRSSDGGRLIVHGFFNLFTMRKAYDHWRKKEVATGFNNTAILALAFVRRWNLLAICPIGLSKGCGLLSVLWILLLLLP